MATLDALIAAGLGDVPRNQISADLLARALSGEVLVQPTDPTARIIQQCKSRAGGRMSALLRARLAKLPAQ